MAVPAGTAGPPGRAERDDASAGAESAVPSPLDEGGSAGHSERAGPGPGENGPREDEPSGPGPSDPEASDREATGRLGAADRLGATITNQKRAAAGGTAGRRTSSRRNGPAPVQIAGGRAG